MILADRIRQFVVEKYIVHAHNTGNSTVTIIAGVIHADMGLDNRMPAICSAIDADKFLSFANIYLVKRSSPNQSSTAEWVFALR